MATRHIRFAPFDEETETAESIPVSSSEHQTVIALLNDITDSSNLSLPRVALRTWIENRIAARVTPNDAEGTLRETDRILEENMMNAIDERPENGTIAISNSIFELRRHLLQTNPELVARHPSLLPDDGPQPSSDETLVSDGVEGTSAVTVPISDSSDDDDVSLPQYIVITENAHGFRAVYRIVPNYLNPVLNEFDHVM